MEEPKNSDPKENSSNVWVLLLVAVVASFLIFAIAAGFNGNGTVAASKTDTSTTKLQDSAISKPPEIKKNWEYSTDTNEMTLKPNYFATTYADSLLYFEFPYNGGALAKLVIRKKEGENNVILKVSKGQFLCDPIDGCTIRVRFDREHPVRYSCVGPSDDNTETLFIDNERGFISKLKRAKRVVIEAQFYQSGYKDIAFNVAGLKWNH